MPNKTNNHRKGSRCGFSVDEDLMVNLCISGSNLEDKVPAAVKICGVESNKIRTLAVG